MLSPFYEFIPHLTYPFSFLFSFFLPFFLSVSLLNLHMSPPLSTFLFTLVTALSQEDAQNCPKLWFSIAWPMTKLPECRVVTNNIISQIDLSSVKCYNKSTRKKKKTILTIQSLNLGWDRQVWQACLTSMANMATVALEWEKVLKQDIRCEGFKVLPKLCYTMVS